MCQAMQTGYLMNSPYLFNLKINSKPNTAWRRSRLCLSLRKKCCTLLALCLFSLCAYYDECLSCYQIRPPALLLRVCLCAIYLIKLPIESSAASHVKRLSAKKRMHSITLHIAHMCLCKWWSLSKILHYAFKINYKIEFITYILPLCSTRTLYQKEDCAHKYSVYNYIL